MKLEMENVGKIKAAAIEFNGLTVIAGENNTGKSTVGKMLFCLFDAFYKVEEQINQEWRGSVESLMFRLTLESNGRRNIPDRIALRKIAKDIVENKNIFSKEKSSMVDKLINYYVDDKGNLPEFADQEFLEQLAGKIQDILNITEDEIRTYILEKRLDAEFGMKIGHLNNPQAISQTRLKIKEREIAIKVIDNEKIKIDSHVSLIKEIIYIDDPFVLDNVINRYPSSYNLFTHRWNLLRKITSQKKPKDFNVIDELVIKRKTDLIFVAMKEVCDGDLVPLRSGGRYIYKTDKLKGSLEMASLSTGLKSFVILRTLLQKGNIDEGGMIVLDEPEIHLHPEWQLKFAEIIVLIQREFDTNFLINTHSPYFLNALEVYSEQYGISDKCKYYLTEESEGLTDIIDATADRECIYRKLAKPLQDLENLEYKMGNRSTNGDTV